MSLLLSVSSLLLVASVSAPANDDDPSASNDVASFWAINLASMLTLATSLTITPTRISSLFSSTYLRVVVFPLPRNPASK